MGKNEGQGVEDGHGCEGCIKKKLKKLKKEVKNGMKRVKGVIKAKGER